MSEKRQTCKVFVGGLSWETTDQRLRNYFENYGAVSEAFVSFDRVTGKISQPSNQPPFPLLRRHCGLSGGTSGNSSLKVGWDMDRQSFFVRPQQVAHMMAP